MASGDEQEKDGAGKGFAGLSSMLSDVDATVTGAEKERAEPLPNDAPHGPARPAPQSQPASKSEPSREPYQQAAEPSGGSSAGKWLLGIGMVIGFLWLVSESGNKSTPSAPARQPQQAPAQSQAPGPQFKFEKLIAPDDFELPSLNLKDAALTEEKPPVGTNLVLGPARLRYCLAEDIRLDAAKGALNNFVESEVDRFNAMVADYNSRCGEFRYRRGSLESARSEVERHRSLLQSEGRSRFPRSPSADARQAPVESSRRQPDATVLAVQRRLNELGYDAGVVDGLAGARTLAAISAFQRDQSIPADGVASRSLLTRLNGASGQTTESSGYGGGRSFPTPTALQAPPQAPIVPEPSSDRGNFSSCISGNYPSLCKHSLLTSEEAVQVASAERRANFKTCISGNYPSLCKHSLLTSEEAVQVAAAERRANFKTCISGNYPSLCNHSLLTEDEAVMVSEAERRARDR